MLLFLFTTNIFVINANSNYDFFCDNATITVQSIQNDKAKNSLTFSIDHI